MQTLSNKKSPTQKTSLNKISMLIRKESRVSALFVQTVAESLGVQFTDIRCLDFLIEARSATAGELAKVTGLTTGATTAMIDRLEKAKFVKRKTDTKDRRKTIVVFTANRSHCPTPVNNFFVKNVPNLLAKYTSKERNIIADWNEKITTLLQSEVERLNKIKSKK